MKTRLIATVGRLGKNTLYDVKTIQALLNVVHRQKNMPALLVTGRCDEDTLAALEDFQLHLHKVCLLKWPLVHQRCPTHRALQAVLDKTVQPTALERPSQGVLTWDSEGHEGGPFHSRFLHVPSQYSGLTIGRGYDCSQKTPKTILDDLVEAGFDVQIANTLAASSGLRGENAERFIVSNDLLDYQITPDQQLKLFRKTYAFIKSYMIRVSSIEKDDAGLYLVDWKKTDARIIDVLVDLTYRGDYTPGSRERLGKFIVDNDFKGLCGAIKDEGLWPKVPADRFRKRVGFCESSL